MVRFQPARSIGIAATAAGILAVSAPGAFAASEGWQVGKVSGRAWASAADGQRSALSRGMELPPGTTLSTDEGSRVMLIRGAETMVVGPHSVIAVSERPSEGLSTTVLEKAGSVQFDVEKRNVRYFSVETPMLAAVVKGTHFTVAVGRGRNGVSVARGTVQVTALATGQMSDVSAGQHAQVGGHGLSVGGAGHPSISLGIPRAAVVSALTTTTMTPQFTPAELAAVATIASPAAPLAAAPVAATQAAAAASMSTVASNTTSASQADHTSSATNSVTQPAAAAAIAATAASSQAGLGGGLVSVIAHALAASSGTGSAGTQGGLNNNPQVAPKAVVGSNPTSLKALLAGFHIGIRTGPNGFGLIGLRSGSGQVTNGNVGSGKAGSNGPTTATNGPGPGTSGGSTHPASGGHFGIGATGFGRGRW